MRCTFLVADDGWRGRVTNSFGVYQLLRGWHFRLLVLGRWGSAESQYFDLDGQSCQIGIQCRRVDERRAKDHIYWNQFI